MSKFAWNYISQFLWILREPDEQQRLKIAVIKAIIEVSWLNTDVKDSIRSSNIVGALYQMLESSSPETEDQKRWAVYALLCLATDDCMVQEEILQFADLALTLKEVSELSWDGWKNNEALKLTELLDMEVQEDEDSNGDTKLEFSEI